MRSAKAAIEATKNVVSFPVKRERREKEELAFLPAALEMVDATVANWSFNCRDHCGAIRSGTDMGNFRARRHRRFRFRQSGAERPS